MVDEHEDWLTRRFDVLTDVDVPGLWEQIVGRVDTELAVDVIAVPRRRWMPFVTAAAALVLVTVGLWALLRDDARPADTPPPPERGNTVQIVEGDGAAATVTTTATAGIVTLDITNPTGDNRAVEIRRIKPGVSMDDIRTNMEQYARTGTSDEVIVEEPPVFAVVHGPDDHFASSVALVAGEYLVATYPLDSLMAAAPGVIADVRLLTIEPGDAGRLPTPTLRFDRLINDSLIGDNLTAAGPATIHVGNTMGNEFRLGLVELRPDVAQYEWMQYVNAQIDSGQFDWTGAPVASVRYFSASAADRTISVDLEGGDLYIEAPPGSDELGSFSLMWVTVE
jgi:hypothetical protein